MHVQYNTIKTWKGCGYAGLIWHQARNTCTDEYSGIPVSQYVVPLPTRPSLFIPFLRVGSQACSDCT